MMLKYFLLIFILLVPLTSHAALSDAIAIEEYEQSGQKVTTEKGKHIYSVDIDSRIKIKIDKRKLSDYTPAMPVESPKEAARLSELKDLLEKANRVKELFVPNSELDTEAGKKYLRAAELFFTKANEFTKEKVWENGREVEKRTELGNQLIQAYKKAQKKYQGNKVYIHIYEAMSKVLAAELGKVISSVNERGAGMPGYEFSLSAYHYSVDGGGTNIAIPPYTAGERCAPRPAERFNLKPNAMTKKELELAQAALPLAEDLLSGKTESGIRKLAKDIKDELARLKSLLQEEELSSVLSDLKLEVMNSTAAEKQIVMEQIDDVKSLLDQIRQLTSLSDNQPDQLLSKISQAGEIIENFQGKISALKERLGKLKALPEKVAKVVSESLKARLKKETETIINNINIDNLQNGLIAQIQSIKSLVSGWKTIQAPAEKLVALSIPLSRIVDVEIDLQSLCSKRKRGDIVKIEASIYSTAPDKKTLVDRTVHSLQLEMVSWYAEPHGYLAFVNPTSTVDTTQNFMAAPALGFYLYHGVRDNRFYNELLKPGIGFGLSALDFDRNKDLEIGISAGFVFFQDSIHVGYGWNLQAKSGYYYFGINPLVLWEISQSKSTSP